MSTHKFYISSFLILLFTGSCIERIDFKVERRPGQLIIDGSLSNEKGDQILMLSETAGTARIPIPIEGANITLYDEQGAIATYNPDERNPGSYVIARNDIEIGRSYFIEIELSNGKKYRSVPETMPNHKAVLSAISYDFTTEKEVSASSIVTEKSYINAYIDVDLSKVEEALYLKWDVEEVFLLTPTDFPDPFGNVPPPCYVYVNTSDIDLNLFNTLGIDLPALTGLKVASQRLDWKFREKHYFTVTQRSLTQEAYEYWEKASDLLSSAGTIFDVPPAPIPGNIYNMDDGAEEVLGYFDVSSTSLIRFLTYRHDIPIDQILECTYSSDKRYRDYPDYCIDCYSVKNSTFARPAFF